MLVLYHNDCFDGLVSAWVVYKATKGTDVRPRFQGVDYTRPETLPVYEPGEDVVIVDFSFSGEVLVNHFKDAKSILLLDHHQAAVDSLKEYFAVHPTPANLKLCLNTDYSGAALTWNWFFSKSLTPPHLVKHVEDYDLWRFNSPNTRAYIERLAVEPQDIMTYDMFSERDYASIVKEGRLLKRKTDAQIRYHVSKVNQCMVDFEGHRVPMLNVPRYMTSLVGDELAKHYEFVMLYFDIGAVRRYSLRAIRGGLDLIPLASIYGGGGHPTAAGFTTPIDKTIVTYL